MDRPEDALDGEEKVCKNETMSETWRERHPYIPGKMMTKHVKETEDCPIRDLGT